MCMDQDREETAIHGACLVDSAANWMARVSQLCERTECFTCTSAVLYFAIAIIATVPIPMA